MIKTKDDMKFRILITMGAPLQKVSGRGSSWFRFLVMSCRTYSPNFTMSIGKLSFYHLFPSIEALEVGTHHKC